MLFTEQMINSSLLDNLYPATSSRKKAERIIVYTVTRYGPQSVASAERFNRPRADKRGTPSSVQNIHIATTIRLVCLKALTLQRVERENNRMWTAINVEYAM